MTHPEFIPSTLPTGTVTFLFTDIEGSTKLLKKLGDQYGALLAEHRRILREIFTRWHGQEVDVQGDSCFFTFPRASDAIAGVVEAQRTFAKQEWPERVKVRIRMGLHTGEPTVVEHGYVGIDVHRAARIGVVGHGEQVLLSDTTAMLIRDDLPPQIKLKDLGKHRLKDISHLERIHQLVIDGLKYKFPPLKSLETELPPVPRNNLPAEVSPFVGRANDLEKLTSLIHDPEVRLLTILGTGGIGKTRLAIKVAEIQLEHRWDRVWFVELASVAASELAVGAVASSLSLQQQKDRSLLEALCDILNLGEVLLILDNCEHVLEGCAILVESLLHQCDRLTVLATSREPLRITGEFTYPMEPMSMPCEDAAIGDLLDSEAGRLFLQRAKEAQPDFEVNETNLVPVIQICRRLDGIPLAIELATALLRGMVPREIAERLDTRFEILTHGSRTALPRQQTLLGTIEWSYNLLSEEEQRLFNRLSIFIGGFTFTAAEWICADEQLTKQNIFDLTMNLFEKSLLVTALDPGGTTRFRMLDSLRHYGLERLDETCVLETYQDRFAEYFRELAIEAEANLYGPDQVIWYDRLESEYDNIREVLRWALDQDEIEIGLDIAWRITEYWRVRGNPFEGVDWLEKLLAQYPTNITHTRAVAQACLGWLEFYSHSVGLAKSLDRLEESLRYNKTLENHKWVGRVLCWAGEVRKWSGDAEGAQEYLEESTSVGEEIGDECAVAEALLILASLSGNPEAEQLAKKALEIHRRIGNIVGIAWALDSLGSQLWARGDWIEALPLIEESIDNYRKVGNKVELAIALQTSMAWISRMKGEYTEAIDYIREARMLFSDIGDQAGIAYTYYLESELLHLLEEFEEAKRTFDKSLELFQKRPEHWVMGQVLSHAGMILLDMGEFTLAEERCKESQEWCLKYNQRRTMGRNLIILGDISLLNADVVRAKSLYQEGLELVQGSPTILLLGQLESLGPLFYSLQGHSHVARVYGALDGFREKKQIVLHPIEKSMREVPLKTARSVLGEEEFLEHYTEGQSMDLKQVLDFSLEVLETI